MKFINNALKTLSEDTNISEVLSGILLGFEIEKKLKNYILTCTKVKAVKMSKELHSPKFKINGFQSACLLKFYCG